MLLLGRGANGPCLARTGDLLLVRREQVTAVWRRLCPSPFGAGSFGLGCCALLQFAASRALPTRAGVLGTSSDSRGGRSGSRGSLGPFAAAGEVARPTGR